MCKSKEPNIAKIVYDAYPHSDLLGIDPDLDCRDLPTLLAKVTTEEIGDGLFNFLVVEIVEGGESTLSGAVRVLVRAREDVDAVLRALHTARRLELRKRTCPACGRICDLSPEEPDHE